MSKEQMQALRRMLAERPQVGSDLAARRAGFAALAGRFPWPEGVSRRPLDAPLTGLEIVPDEAVPGRTLLYLHGGAFVIGSANSHAELAARIALAGRTRVVSPDYRLAPEHPFPQPLDDCFHAYEHLLDGGQDPATLAIGGDSAGANLAAAVLLRAKAAGLPMPGALVLLSAYLDLTNSGDSIRERAHRDPFIDTSKMDFTAGLYLHGADPRAPLASPLFGDVAGFPPTLLLLGEEEVLYDDSRRFADKLAAAGVEATFQAWPDMVHVFPFFGPLLDEGRAATEYIGRWLAERLG